MRKQLRPTRKLLGRYFIMWIRVFTFLRRCAFVWFTYAIFKIFVAIIITIYFLVIFKVSTGCCTLVYASFFDLAHDDIVVSQDINEFATITSRLRGGGDISCQDESEHDTTIDTTFLDELCNISVPTSWRVLPPVLENLSIVLSDIEYVGLETCGDGACGLHSLYGMPLKRELDNIIELRYPNVRQCVIDRLPELWEDACELHDGHLKQSLTSWIYGKFIDLMDSKLMEVEKEKFKKALPENIEQDVLQHKLVREEYEKTRVSCLNSLAVFLDSFFTEDNEFTLVRPLARCVGYIPEDMANPLVTDVADIVYDIDRFKFLAPSAEGSPFTKYQMLFRQTLGVGMTDFRKAFFHTSNDKEGREQQSIFLDCLQEFCSTDMF